MDLILLVLILVLMGFIIYVLTTRIPMPPGWASAIQVVTLIIVLLYLLSRFTNLPNVLPH